MYLKLNIGKTNIGDKVKLTKKYYQESLESHTIKPNYLNRIILSFIFGGIICLIGQCILSIAALYTEYDVEVMLAIVIFVSILASGLGIYDKLGQIAYAGSIVPISGFANSVASSAMEYRPEGLLLGISANIFKLAGSVIVNGVIATIVVGLIRIGLSLL